jgi:uncharacterized protein (TIGR02145 family)
MRFLKEMRMKYSKMLFAVFAAMSVLTACGDDSSNSASNGTISFGTLADPRDGQTYKTVQIGNQVWMAENLDFKTADSYCYNDSTEYCEKYGRLYTWATAKESCPMGWHLPSKEEWLTLFAVVGDSSSACQGLKSTNGWFDNLNGTDDVGFSMLPGGFRDVGGTYLNEKRVAFFWSSAENDNSFAYYMSFVSTSSAKLNDPSLKLDYKNEALSVRCIKELSGEL